MTAYVPPSAAHANASANGLSRRSLLRAGTLGSLSLALGAAGVLSACGSGDIVSAVVPSRFISFGDGLSDVGQGSTGLRYTINDSTVNTWADRLASRYGLTLTAQSAGGQGYAEGHAVGAPLPRSLTQQVDAFFGAANTANTLGSNDVVLINLPLSDVLTPVAQVKAGTLSETAALAQIDASGKAYVTQVNRLIAAGAKYIVVVGAYDLGKSPWAIAQDQVSLFTAASIKLNDSFKLAAVNLGANVLFVDAASLVNRNVLAPGTYGFTNINTAVCIPSSALNCTSSTLVSGATATAYLFADSIYLTPAGNQQLGDYAYTQLSGRW